MQLIYSYFPFSETKENRFRQRFNPSDALEINILYYFDQMFTDFGFFARRDGR
jgi:hypothetical protein